VGANRFPAARSGNSMKILVCGADVVGCIYAARLHCPEHEVTILALGDCLSALQRHGVILYNAATAEELFLHLPVVEELAADDYYDLALISVPLSQWVRLPFDLGNNKHFHTALFMAGHCGACEDWRNTLDCEHLLLGYPGFGGVLNSPVVEYREVPSLLPRATIGPFEDSAVPELRQAICMFRRAGLSVSTCRHMDSLLKTQAAIFVSLAGGVRAAELSGTRLGDDLGSVQLVVRSIRECFAVLNELQVRITPGYLEWLSFAPSKCLSDLLLQWSRTTAFELLVAAQAKTAADEIAHLTDQLRLFSMLAAVETPAFNELSEYLTAQPEPLAPRYNHAS
jgi:2-dehydropantoate 2-reductase